jgi:hypothetical protein
MKSIELLVVKVEKKLNLNRVIWFGYIWEKIDFLSYVSLN